ncbi:hypothetical protein [Phenylobacterium sp.]|uniref:hypothetical protein n=1 Tax=Phenylobacterium sp. TaxID=1871053 RepID=UPI00120A6BA4|nr:hypothetical protein [Phenylobacterium sp.]THD62416.1 MAG: hypothetical protein E8A49_07740 [Phenylobacterium sp.]
MYPSHIDPIFFAELALVFGGCIFSFWKGGFPERIGGGVVLANTLLMLLLGASMASGLGPVVELVVDGLTAVALLAVVLVFGSLWLGGAMLLYAVQFTLHAFYFVTERAPDKLHAIVNNVDFTGIIWCLVIGTAVAWRRRIKSAAVA